MEGRASERHLGKRLQNSQEHGTGCAACLTGNSILLESQVEYSLRTRVPTGRCPNHFTSHESHWRFEPVLRWWLVSVYNVPWVWSSNQQKLKTSWRDHYSGPGEKRLLPQEGSACSYRDISLYPKATSCHRFSAIILFTRKCDWGDRRSKLDDRSLFLNKSPEKSRLLSYCPTGQVLHLQTHPSIQDTAFLTITSTLQPLVSIKRETAHL